MDIPIGANLCTNCCENYLQHKVLIGEKKTKPADLNISFVITLWTPPFLLEKKSQQARGEKSTSLRENLPPSRGSPVSDLLKYRGMCMILGVKCVCSESKIEFCGANFKWIGENMRGETRTVQYKISTNWRGETGFLGIMSPFRDQNYYKNYLTICMLHTKMMRNFLRGVALVW